MNLKEYIYTVKKRSYNASQRASYPSYDKVERILLLYPSDWTERNSAIRAMIKQLQEENKKVVAWGYCPKKELLSPILPDSRMLGLVSSGWLGTLKQDVLQDLDGMSFDLLIDLTVSPVLPLQYVALYAKADFKIGCREQDGVYNMVIPVTDDATPEYLFEQVMHYLKLIKSAD